MAPVSGCATHNQGQAVFSQERVHGKLAIVAQLIAFYASGSGQSAIYVIVYQYINFQMVQRGWRE